jgi:hypothetical protein
MNHSEPERGSVKKMAFLRVLLTSGCAKVRSPNFCTRFSHGFRNADSRARSDVHGFRRPLQCSTIGALK